MTGWTLAIDLGTSFVCAATSVGGKIEVLEIENTRYLPSAVLLDQDGNLVTGRAAASQGEAFPERLERLPKRALVSSDQVLLAGTPVSTVDLVATLLERVAEEATRRVGLGSPSTVVLTHPARWGQPERDRLIAAAEKAGLSGPLLLAEPVAAATWYAHQADIPVGGTVAVFDLGGGTLDTAVLRRAAGGFLVAGMPGGDAHFGGEDVDEHLLELAGAHAREQDEAAWDRIWTGPGRAGRRNQALVRRDLVVAKESLSSSPTHHLYPPGFDDGLRVTRRELEASVEPQLSGAVDALLATLDSARVEPKDLAALFLTGGATRMPRVSEILTERTGLLPRVTGDPKASTVLGALYAVDPPVTTDPPAPKPPADRPDARTGAVPDGDRATPNARPTVRSALLRDARASLSQSTAPLRPGLARASSLLSALVAARTTLRRLLVPFGLALVIVAFPLGSTNGAVRSYNLLACVEVLLAGLLLLLAAVPDPAIRRGRAARLTALLMTLSITGVSIRHHDHAHSLHYGSGFVLLTAAILGCVALWLLELPSRGWRSPALTIAAVAGWLLGEIEFPENLARIPALILVLSWVVTGLTRLAKYLVRITRDNGEPSSG
ncbi:Hsp70 family protein [Frankia sp. AgB1.9]|uniref:Hsp70 family protein n=1 Tax=unclassified Frankia TaxID=2632575 RepID=UPI001933ECAA|nr:MULTISPECIES: Hsp70 family protein [unclassified Frankia]MBL7493221.1 Hsp70 family protein [Frankia sp. AgW1.1]MBL7553339.1 Hsp70 family protein [Frankia sp. AgB1.9]MBL7624842.1 Hsp70 family protein [Frankia sp. AgB1.8]